MFYELGKMKLEYYRCPIRLELARHVAPLLLFVFFIALGLGYAWARAVFCNLLKDFRRLT